MDAGSIAADYLRYSYFDLAKMLDPCEGFEVAIALTT
jgi:hypothetical protein